MRRATRDGAPPGAAPPGVAVDARALHATGIGRYLRELLAQWLAEPPFARLTLLGDPGALGDFLGEHRSPMPVDVVAHRGGFYSPAAQWSWVRARRLPAVRTAVLFFPHWDAPLVGLPRRSLVTVHDLTPFRVPDAFGASRRVLGRPALARVLRTAGLVTCGSHATADDLRALVPALAPRLRVVPYGVSARFAAPAPALARPPATPYMLCVGNQKPHKNLAAAVGALALLRAAGDVDVRLVVVGRRFGDGVGALARAAGVADAVDEWGEVDDATLHGLYAGCVALLFPSRYEGFGLPVVEAMAAGAPVIASNTPAVAEAVGGAAPIYAPDDAAGMAAAVHALLGPSAWRAELVARGRARAAHLSWRHAARDVAHALGELGASVGTPAVAAAPGAGAARRLAAAPGAGPGA